MTDTPKAEAKSTDDVALVGSAAPVVRLRANVTVLGLQVGEVASFAADDEEALANVVSGNLTRL